MKVVLINPDYMKYSSPPLGLAYLASYCEKVCPYSEFYICDQINEKMVFKSLKKQSPDIIGIGAVSENFYEVNNLAKKIKKEYPPKILLLGGIHITTSPESFNDSIFDVAVIGEGETPFSEIIKCLYKNRNKDFSLKMLKDVKGLLIRFEDGIINTGKANIIKDLDSIPLPNRELLNMKYYSLPTFSSGDDCEPSGSLITARGCPYNCVFCSSNAFWGRKVRYFSAKRVVQEIEILYKEYKYKKIIFYDDTFTLNAPRLKEILKLMKKKGLNGLIDFTVYGRANTFNEEIASILKELNVKQIVFGMETGSQKMLDYLKKGNVTVEDNINAHKRALKYGIRSSAFLMIGSPYETIEDVNQTKKLIENHLKNDFIIYQTIPFPATEIWAYALSNGIIDKGFYDRKQKEFIDIDTSLLLTKEISKEDFIRMFNEIRSLHLKNNRDLLLSKLKTLKYNDLKKFFSIIFLRKAYNLKNGFLKRIIPNVLKNKNWGVMK